MQGTSRGHTHSTGPLTRASGRRVPLTGAQQVGAVPAREGKGSYAAAPLHLLRSQEVRGQHAGSGQLTPGLLPGVQTNKINQVPLLKNQAASCKSYSFLLQKIRQI